MSITESVKSSDLDQTIDCIENNVDVNERDELGRVPLMIAALNKDIEIFKLLLREGASTTIKDYRGVPLVYYMKDAKELWIDEILSNVYMGDIDYIDIDGRNMAHWAAINLNISIMKQIEMQRKNFLYHQRDYESKCPIHYSTLHNNRSILDFLKNVGVDINLKDGNGLSVSELAIIHDNPLCITSKNLNTHFLKLAIKHKSYNCVNELREKSWLLYFLTMV